ncbi:MAG: hypothetical protein Q7S10_03190 [bacterium]|nr:hypothetical protein [bacterium]
MQNSKSVKCQSCHQAFTIEPEDFQFYERLDLPLPERCVYCRWKYLLAFWITGRFRIAKSALSGKRIITILPESTSFPIYDREEFVSDAWDPLTYGRDYDSSRPFINQLVELQSVVPHPHQTGVKNTNCDWTDDVWESKNVYLTRSGWRAEDVSYGYRTFRCKNSIDVSYCIDTEYSYDCLYCFKCYNLEHSFNCRDCIDSTFLYDCRNCQNCFLSWNLRNKQYCFLNQQYTKEEYFKKIQEFNLKSFTEREKLKDEFWGHVREDAVHRATYNVKTEQSKGNFLSEGKNCYECYFLEKSENCRYCFRGTDSKDSIDIMGAVSEKCGLGCLDQWGYGNICNLYTTQCRYSAYLDSCEECEYCFGCVGLRKKKYCILNKQYTKEEYEALVGEIKSNMKERGEWGTFWPLKAAYAGYNYSLAGTTFPMTRDEAITFGAKWEEPAAPDYEGVSGDDLPSTIQEVNDDVIKQRIICPITKLSYNITSFELSFYKERGIPLPRRHFDLRGSVRYQPLNYMTKSHKGVCVYCRKEIEHYYAPELGFQKIACVDCYQKEIA